MPQIIQGPLLDPSPQRKCVLLHASRLTLAKRRWAGKADDGTEFGFDLDHPLAHGSRFHQTDSAVYMLVQEEEPVLEMPLDLDGAQAARLGWSLGNLHFPIELTEKTLRVVDDPAVRQLLEREHVTYCSNKSLFQPQKAAHSHGHAH